MAREAGFADGVVDIVGFEGFVNFANLVAAHEREECAKMCAELRRMAIAEERGTTVAVSVDVGEEVAVPVQVGVSVGSI